MLNANQSIPPSAAHAGPYHALGIGRYCQQVGIANTFNTRALLQLHVPTHLGMKSWSACAYNNAGKDLMSRDSPRRIALLFNCYTFSRTCVTLYFQDFSNLYADKTRQQKQSRRIDHVLCPSLSKGQEVNRSSRATGYHVFLLRLALPRSS